MTVCDDRWRKPGRRSQPEAVERFHRGVDHARFPFAPADAAGTVQLSVAGGTGPPGNGGLLEIRPYRRAFEGDTLCIRTPSEAKSDALAADPPGIAC